MTTAYLGLGSNLGNRLAFLRGGRDTLITHRDIELAQTSGVYETAALGGPSDSPDFLNAVLQVDTILTPHALLDWCLTVEDKFGRTRPEPWAARTLDIDILLYADEIISDQRLTVPHPRILQRSFVLAPLCEIAPELMHPLCRRTIADLTAANNSAAALRPLHTDW
ncbi:MAG: 2-amino-4-hydroxy-6-hydroxymethyldihydropteridine diphosphokinase [Desulfuromonadales bacterium]|nr:2-amino-4-hydroxy-6-hydroxymethyldihydropteridine diphosphokinase [Desulfuromonadales bacterium]